jgi:hypothetical protein
MICATCRTANADDIRYGNLPMCNKCWEKEKALQAENMSPANQQARVDAANAVSTRQIEQDVVKLSQQIDSSITVSSDIFNAKTTAILDLKAAIDNDESITNKPYKLAETLKTRFEHLTGVIFNAGEQIKDANNEQKAIQQFLNNLANSLRSEEREKLRLADIKYQPQPVKSPTVKTVKTTGTRQSKVPAHRQKLDKESIKKYAAELGVPEFHIQQICVSQGVIPEKAAEIVRTMLAKMRAAANQ